VPQQPTVKLLTFNIAHGRGLGLYQGLTSDRRIRRNLDRIAGLLAECGADVVALQEVDQDSHWNRRIDLLEYLRERSGFPHAIWGINTRRAGRKPLAYGNALLSRWPVSEADNRPFGNKTLGEKGFLYAQVDTPEGPLALINLHLDYRSRKLRLSQVNKILDYTNAREDPLEPGRRLAPVICGDFNARSGRLGDAVRHLASGLVERGHYHLCPRNAQTFPAQFPTHCLDFVFIPEPWRESRARVLRSFLSDHRPVLVEFRYDHDAADRLKQYAGAEPHHRYAAR